MPGPRPDPDALLQHIIAEEQQETRGKLKIYLGAAPGVGKTYSMLHDALVERSKGLDVVIGVAESHGRQEINLIIKKFHILPKLSVNYNGKTLLEFDLDAALKRHPGLILIDEMAHTNVPNVRHKKRWQDIKELIDCGIDVYTTLNVQHIESLNNDVYQIIHAPVHETVPDLMLEMADTIELVDLPPEELLERLHDGKIYVPKQAELASEFFFRKGNLIALRELALRIVAQSVRAQVLLYRQNQGIKNIWPTSAKLLVCVGGNIESLRLIRIAKQISSNLKTDWVAVYVDTTFGRTSKQKLATATKQLHLAEQLGAEIRVLTGLNIVKEILAFAREQNVTQIMVAKHIRTRWRDIFMRNLSDEIVRESGEIDVYIMTGSKGQATSETGRKVKFQSEYSIHWHMYVFSISTIAIITWFSFLLSPFIGHNALIMLYMIGITTISLFGGLGPSILGSLFGIISYDFLFLGKPSSFTDFNPESWFVLLSMFGISQIISQLTIIMRRQIKVVRLFTNQTSALYKLSRQLSRTRGIDSLLCIGVDYIGTLFASEVLALLPRNGSLLVQAACNKNATQLSEKEQAIAEWVYKLGQNAGKGADSLSFSSALCIQLLAAQGVIGVLRIQPLQEDAFSSPENMRLLEACANQIALALEVDNLQEKQKLHISSHQL